MLSLVMPLVMRLLGAWMEKRGKDSDLYRTYTAFAREYQAFAKSPAEVSDEFLKNREEAQKPAEEPKS